MKYVAAPLICLFLLVIPGIAQKNSAEDQEQSLKRKDVPTAVLEAFTKSYPHAKATGFSKETEKGSTVYELESKDGATSRDLTYTQDGTVISIEESMPYADLPDAVRGTLAKEYPKYKASACEKVTKGSVAQFEVLLASGKKKVEVVLDAAGAIVTTEQKGKR